MADWTPTLIDGCRLWVAADQIAGLADTDPVATWADLSGSGHNLGQSVALNRPIYRTSMVNGLPTVVFSGTNQSRMFNAAFPNLHEFTVFSVYRPTIAPSGANPEILWAHEVPTGGNSGYRLHLVGGLNLTTGGIGGNTVSLPQTTSRHQVISTQRSGTTALHASNGVTAAIASPTYTGTLGRFVLGVEWVGQPFALDAEVCECIVYNTSVTTEQRQQVEGYLSHKWGLAAFLPSGHPYKSVPPTVDSGPILRSPHALNYLDPTRILSSPHLIESL